jgi:hypothetical protein
MRFLKNIWGNHGLCSIIERFWDQRFNKWEYLSSGILAEAILGLSHQCSATTLPLPGY